MHASAHFHSTGIFQCLIVLRQHTAAGLEYSQGRGSCRQLPSGKLEWQPAAAARKPATCAGRALSALDLRLWIVRPDIDFQPGDFAVTVPSGSLKACPRVETI